jgi:NAD(P)-dependent dehydrogenase (short-subunit alcohol dehydrogenase family)
MDKVVVVTGADKGFGYELTREFCALFENVYITGRMRDYSELKV